MSRVSPFVVGLVLGTVALGAGLLAYRYLPELNGGSDSVRDRLLSEIAEEDLGLRRALPKAARTRPCGFGEALVRAQRQSVRPVAATTDTDVDTDATYDHETPESQIDAMLNATTCQRPGAPIGLDTEELADLLRSGPMLVRRSFASGEPAVARAWALRIWALGQDLVTNDSKRFMVLGHQLQTVAIDALAWWLAQPNLPAAQRDDAQVLATGLLERAHDPRQLVRGWASRSMRLGLEDPSATAIEGEVLAAEVAEAARWWTAVGVAVATPGAEPPAVLDVEQGPAVRKLLVDERVLEFAGVQKHLLRAKLAAALMYRRAEDAGEGCPAPWDGEPPVDPVSGTPAEWDANLCQLGLGDRRYGPGATSR